MGSTGEGRSTTAAGLGLAGRSSSSTLLCVNKSPCLINLAPALAAYTVQIFSPEMAMNHSTLPVYYQQPLVLPGKLICKNMRSQGRVWALSKHQTQQPPEHRNEEPWPKGLEQKEQNAEKFHLTSTEAKNPVDIKKIIIKWKPMYFSSNRLFFWYSPHTWP